MPIYPYVCTACGHEFDALQKISDEPLTECPECGESTLKKRLAAPAFQLKGTGWYETDFKNTGKKQDAPDKSKNDQSSDKKDQGGKSSSEGSGSAASDTQSKSKAAAGTDD